MKYKGVMTYTECKREYQFWRRMEGDFPINARTIARVAIWREVWRRRALNAEAVIKKMQMDGDT